MTEIRSTLNHYYDYNKLFIAVRYFRAWLPFTNILCVCKVVVIVKIQRNIRKREKKMTARRIMSKSLKNGMRRGEMRKRVGGGRRKSSSKRNFRLQFQYLEHDFKDVNSEREKSMREKFNYINLHFFFFVIVSKWIKDWWREKCLKLIFLFHWMLFMTCLGIIVIRKVIENWMLKNEFWSNFVKCTSKLDHNFFFCGRIFLFSSRGSSKLD